MNSLTLTQHIIWLATKLENIKRVSSPSFPEPCSIRVCSGCRGKTWGPRKRRYGGPVSGPGRRWPYQEPALWRELSAPQPWDAHESCGSVEKRAGGSEIYLKTHLLFTDLGSLALHTSFLNQMKVFLFHLFLFSLKMLTEKSIINIMRGSLSLLSWMLPSKIWGARY